MVSLRGALVMPTGLDGGTETAQKPPTALSTSLALLPHPEAPSAPNPESETPADIPEPRCCGRRLRKAQGIRCPLPHALSESLAQHLQQNRPGLPRGAPLLYSEAEVGPSGTGDTGHKIRGTEVRP